MQDVAWLNIDINVRAAIYCHQAIEERADLVFPVGMEATFAEAHNVVLTLE